MPRYFSREEKRGWFAGSKRANGWPRWRRRRGFSASRFTNGGRRFGRMGAAGLNRKRGPKPGGRAAVEPPSADAGPPAGRPPDELAKAKARVAELERLVGRQQADLDFFREALRSWDEKRHAGGATISSPHRKNDSEGPQGETNERG